MLGSMRKKVIAGNWKMNMLPNEAIDFINNLENQVKDTENEVVICVPYTDIFYSVLNAQNTNIKIETLILSIIPRQFAGFKRK